MLRVDPDIGVHYVSAVHYEIDPLRAVVHCHIGNSSPVEPVDAEQYGANGVLVGRKDARPDVSIAIERSTTVDIDVYAAKSKEACCVLELVSEC